MQIDTQNIANIHASCLIIGVKGVLICGKSGSGKTSLMLSLLDRSQANSGFAAMISDDQVLVNNCNNQLIARCPAPTKGLYETRGFGIGKRFYQPSTMVDLVVEIVNPEKLDRLPDGNTKVIEEVQVPLIAVPQYHHQQAIQIILASLDNQKPYQH